MSVTWPEARLEGWIGNSIILMTGSLLLYHMTRVMNPSLYIHPYLAAFIVSGLILVDFSFSLLALIPYNMRFKSVWEKNKDKEEGINYENERIFHICYTIVIVIFICFQLMIVYYVIRDSIERVKLIKSPKKYKRKRK